MSNRTELHDKIQQITAKIIDLNSQFAQAEHLSQLDIDLLRRYTVDLYDAMQGLKTEANTQPVITVPTTPKIQPPVQEVKKDVPPTIVANEPKIISTPLPPKQEIPKPEPTHIPEPIPVVEVKEEPTVEPPKVEEVKAPIIEEKLIEVPVMEEKKVEIPTPTPPPVAPQPVAQPVVTAPKVEVEEIKEASLNDLLHKPEGNDLASKLQQTPIHDLKKAISINKKFEFINHLFSGDHESYTKSIHYINGLNNGNDATMFFNNLKREYAWDEENKLYLEFSDLVRRRFM